MVGGLVHSGMSQYKTEVSIADVMTSVHNGEEYDMCAAPDGRIRVSTSARYCLLSLEGAKEALTPMSPRRPPRPLHSPAIDKFERDLRALVHDLNAQMATARTV